MPTSRYKHTPAILNAVLCAAPESILDVGTGFGKWGHLFREYTDIARAEEEPERYHRPHWKVRIDGIEGHAPYITPAHEYLYDNIYIGDMTDKIREVGVYDVIFLGDVIEHAAKEEGRRVLRLCLERARKMVVVTTPPRFKEQPAVCNNPLEEHRSHWRARDFHALAPAVTRKVVNKLVAILFPDEAQWRALQPAVQKALGVPLWRRLVSAVHTTR